VNLYSPTFEKRLRAHWKRAVRQNQELKREWNRAPAMGRSRPCARVLIRLLVSLGLGIAVFAAGSLDWPPGAQSAIGAVWFFGSVFMLRARILETFYRIDYLAALTVWPASHSLVWRWNNGRAWKLAWRTALDALAVLSGMALAHEADLGGWLLILPATALLTALMQAMAVWLIFVPVPQMAQTLPGAVFVGLILLANVSSIREWVFQIFMEQGETMSLILPGGWVLRPYLGVVLGGELELLILLIPACAGAASMVWAQRRLASTYTPFDFALWHAFQAPPAEFKDRFNQILAEQPAPPGPTETTEAIRSREFLAPGMSFRAQGWIERRVLRRLSPREWAVLELACLDLPRWTRTAWSGCGLIAAAIAGAAIAQRATVDSVQVLSVWIAVICGAGGGLLALPYSPGFSRYFQPVDLGGVMIPFGALFPASFKELLRLAIKINLIRGLMVLPFFWVAGGILGAALDIPIWRTARSGLAMVLLAIAFTPMLLATQLSTLSNDTSNVSWRSFLLVLVFVAGYLGFIGAGIAVFFVPWPGEAAFLVMAAGISALLAKFYAHLDSRRKFDLMSRRKE
jgi:hypothetical protein